jgi:hypothetical protein
MIEKVCRGRAKTSKELHWKFPLFTNNNSIQNYFNTISNQSINPYYCCIQCDPNFENVSKLSEITAKKCIKIGKVAIIRIFYELVDQFDDHQQFNFPILRNLRFFVPDGKEIFDLKAIIVHIGKSVEYGHYISYIFVDPYVRFLDSS